MGFRIKREPTVEELLSDPMMELLYRHSGTTAAEVRALMQEAAARLARSRAGDGEVPLEVDRSRLRR